MLSLIPFGVCFPPAHLSRHRSKSNTHLSVKPVGRKPPAIGCDLTWTVSLLTSLHRVVLPPPPHPHRAAKNRSTCNSLLSFTLMDSKAKPLVSSLISVRISPHSTPQGGFTFPIHHNTKVEEIHLSCLRLWVAKLAL